MFECIKEKGGIRMENKEKKYYPAMLDLSCFNIYVIGGGKVAYRKVKKLMQCGGKIHIISKTLDPMFDEVMKEIDYIKGAYDDDVIEKATLVIAATNDKKLNERIGIKCKELGILCNVVSDPQLSSYIAPASMRRGSLVISVSTEGKAPVVAKEICMTLETQYNDKYADYIEYLCKNRKQCVEKKKNNQ